jgi:single-strand DNA-binding protein
MASLNRVLLIGHLTKDPEISFTSRGTPVAALGLAVNRLWTDEEGRKHEEVTFVDIVLWARLAEIAQQYLRKGSPLFLEGRLQLETWEQAGQKRSKLRVVGESLQLLGKREGIEAASAAPPRPAMSPPERGQTAPASKAPGVDPELNVDPF